jgi:hypothetical protein
MALLPPSTSSAIFHCFFTALEGVGNAASKVFCTFTAKLSAVPALLMVTGE